MGMLSFILISSYMYIRADRSPESKLNSNFKLSHAQLKCQAREKKIKMKLKKNTKWEMKLIFPCLIANNASFEKQW